MVGGTGSIGGKMKDKHDSRISTDKRKSKQFKMKDIKLRYNDWDDQILTNLKS